MTRKNPYTKTHSDEQSAARTGILATRHGEIHTPAFLPDATQATVKHVSPEELHNIELQIALANLYHLWLRPGIEVIEAAGGLHNFMQWDGPILTDSGGYQVFSLLHSKGLGKITPQGAEFRSHLDGSKKLLTPELSIELQYRMGSDILMMLDESAPGDSDIEYIKKSVDLTLKWAQRSKETFEDIDRSQERLLFGIVQGGIFQDELVRSAKATVEIGFDAYALGGVAVGLDEETTHSVLGYSLDQLPEDRLRYVMGVGYPVDMVRAIELGADFFDCVIPTRNARHGSLFSRSEGMINITAARYKLDQAPVDTECDCYTCSHFSRSYICHLIRANEGFGQRLATIHNLRYYMWLFQEVRRNIEAGTFMEFKERIVTDFTK